MSKSDKKETNTTANGHVVRSENSTRVVKSSPAKTIVAKEAIRSAVLAVKLAK